MIWLVLGDSLVIPLFCRVTFADSGVRHIDDGIPFEDVDLPHANSISLSDVRSVGTSDRMKYAEVIEAAQMLTLSVFLRGISSFWTWWANAETGSKPNRIYNRRASSRP